MAGNCAPPITVKGAVIVLFQALEEIPPHGNTLWLGKTYFEKPERRPIVQYGNGNQVVCGEHATGTTGGAQIYTSPGSSMTGNRHHLNVFSEEDLFEEELN